MSSGITMRGFFICFFGVVLPAVAAEDDLLIKVKEGSLVGTEVVDEVDERSFYAFYNIPYAQKPIGERRFKDPLEPLPWDGVREAKEVGHACISYNMMFQNVEGSEDCLHLNVYTPKPPSQLLANPLPVMVWIHGGAFHTGSSNPLIYGPDFLMFEDIVLVTINYRLSSFGFLSLQNEEVPGNAGLKDQVMALKWIKENIAAFGGDANNVTIFGESAGGASIHFLMLSPMAKGLFHRAIMQSGTALNPWALTKQTVNPALKLADLMKCPKDDSNEMLKCLQKVDAAELAERQYGIIDLKFTELLNVKIFLPCIEPNVSKNPFLMDSPRNLVINGQYNDVPFIIGTVEMETLFLSKVLLGGLIEDDMKESFYSELKKDPSMILNMKLDDVPDSMRQKLGEEIIKFYFKDLPLSDETIINLVNATSDIFFLLGSHDVVTNHLRVGKSSVFQYHFTLETDYGRVKGMLDSDLKGPAHGDDVGYLFYLQLSPPEINPNSEGYKGMRRMVKLWTNFAKFGNPTPNSELNVEWKAATPKNAFYLDIGSELVLKENVEKERIEFWDNLRLSENLPDF